MPAWICATCGVQRSDTAHAPARCAICDDERKYVGRDGQQWPTMADLAETHEVVIKEEKKSPACSGSG